MVYFFARSPGKHLQRLPEEDSATNMTQNQAKRKTEENRPIQQSQHTDGLLSFQNQKNKTECVGSISLLSAIREVDKDHTLVFAVANL